MKYVALYLAAALGIVFALQSLLPLTDELVLRSADVAARPWMLLTSMFAHGSLYHLLSNVVALALFGLVLEGVIGWKRWLAVYFVGGIAAGVAAALFYPASLGASGAVFGVIGALAVLRPRTVVFALGVPMPMIVAAGVWALLDIGGMFNPGDIANAAHLGGLAAGLLFGLYYKKTFPEERHKRQKATAVSDKELDRWEDEYL
ncbi:MAG: rhomboid family intramembrane serine protease [Candidatus Aenigmarchaeota archaeon]|nr:rhomboid family intramembrane serine protease [Candidatus Aenigmarchaeota archaeon]